jgi:two-component system cell cycle response regulator
LDGTTEMSGRVLVVDDVATNRILLQARLAGAFYDPVLAADGSECLACAVEQAPDLILLDLGLPDLPGQEVLRRLRADPRTRDIPVIVLTADGSSAARLGAFSAGADDVISRPASDAVLLARVRNLLRARGVAGLTPVEGLAEPASPFQPEATVAIVSAQPDLAGHLRGDLAALLRQRLVVLSRAQALAEASVHPARVPDVFILLDDGSDNAGQLRLLSELRSHPATRHAAVSVLGPAADGEEAAMAFDLGADDVVTPDVSPAELALRTGCLVRRKQAGDRQRLRMQDSLRLALIDPLTGLYNRRYAGPKLAAIAARSLAESGDFAVMVIDLDRFKLVNDQHGHAAGDQVLVELARRLTASLRASDLLARIGGEEFLAVLPDTDLALAQQVARRLCEVVEERPFRLASGAALTITVSIGVAVSGDASGRPLSAEALVEEADLALRESKLSGRNQVSFRRSAA